MDYSFLIAFVLGVVLGGFGVFFGQKRLSVVGKKKKRKAVAKDAAEKRTAKALAKAGVAAAVELPPTGYAPLHGIAVEQQQQQQQGRMPARSGNGKGEGAWSGS